MTSWIWGQAISGQTTYTDLCCEEFDQNRKENYELFILDSCTNLGACSIFIYGAMGVKWTTLTFKELAAQRTLRMDPKYWIKKKASSRKQQATSLPQSGDIVLTTKGKS